MTAKKTASKKAGKKTAAKKSGKTPAKQTAIPGTKPKRDKKLEELAEAYEEKRDERLAWAKQEAAAKAELIAYMQAKGVSMYMDGDLEVALQAKDATPNVKVKRTEPNTEAA